MKTDSFKGMMRVVQFNWPIYLAAIITAVVFFVLIFIESIDSNLRILFGLAAIIVVAQTIASLAISHLIYDTSSLNDWQWIKETVAVKVPRILVVHAGYDETDNALPGIFPSSEIATIDFHDALESKEPSIEKARELYPSKVTPICTTIDDWPIDDRSVDLVLLAFAVHEIRDEAQRLLLFNEVRRVLSDKGQAMLIEHLRDMPNCLAFGPGFFHFFPRSEWLKCARLTSLTVKKESKITPFVGVFKLCR